MRSLRTQIPFLAPSGSRDASTICSLNEGAPLRTGVVLRSGKSLTSGMGSGLLNSAPLAAGGLLSTRLQFGSPAQATAMKAGAIIRFHS